MNTNEFYRTIMEFGDVFSNKLSQVLAQNTGEISTETAQKISQEIEMTTRENFGILIDNLMLVEKRQKKLEESSSKNKTAKKTTKRKR